MKLSLKVATIILASAILVGILLDAFLVAPKVPWISGAVGLKLDVVFLGTPFRFPKFGVIVPYGLLMVVVAGLLIPRRSWKTISSWWAAAQTWVRMLGWSFATPVLLIIGKFFYKVGQGYLTDWLKTIAESFGIAANVFIFDHEFFQVDASLATLFGLALGVYLFLWQGVQKGLLKR